MRIHLNGAYSANGSFELRHDDGSLYLTVEPDQIVRIGNSIGGFWAKPITYAGQRMLALVRIGGSMVNRPVEQIRRRFGKERGTILQPGLGLWAMSSGAARRGVWHRIREDADPIRQSLRSMGLPSNLVRTVDEINEEVYEGGRLCKHLAFGGSSSWFLTDGEVEHLEDASYVTRENCSGNQYHIGCPDGPARKRVTGGSYLITGADVSRSDIRFAHPTVCQVLLTPRVDLGFVAKLVKTGNRYDAVQAVEVEYGLRCPECKREGCNLALHEAERRSTPEREKAARYAAQVVTIRGEEYRLLAEQGDTQWNGRTQALERVSDGAAFVAEPGNVVKPAETKTVTDLKSRPELTWEAADGKWRVRPSVYPRIS